MSAILYPRLVHAGRHTTPARFCVAHKSKLAKTKKPTEYAKEHFDAFYGKVFGSDQWMSARIAMLSKKKHCAVLNPFTLTDNLIERMKDLGCQQIFRVNDPIEVNEKPLPAVEFADPPDPLPEMIPQENFISSFEDSSRVIQKGNTEPLLSFVPATEMVYQEEVIDEGQYFEFFKPEEETEIAVKTRQTLPPLPLKIFSFPAGNVSDFPTPQKKSNGLYEYYLLDAASILPVMALNVQPNEDFADFCAAPGGKTLAVAFTRNARTHFCSDLSSGRVRRLENILLGYLPKEEREKITVKHGDMTRFHDDMTYDKILVDVPCSNDRVSLENEDHNLFHPTRTKIRLALPELQKRILTSALRRLRVGGAAVYSTCSLSPVQNDSVVHMTLQSFKEMKFVVNDLTETFAPFASRRIFHFYDKCRYGQLVLPNLGNNFGPMYICRIERVK